MQRPWRAAALLGLVSISACSSRNGDYRDDAGSVVSFSVAGCDLARRARDDAIAALREPDSGEADVQQLCTVELRPGTVRPLRAAHERLDEAALDALIDADPQCGRPARPRSLQGFVKSLRIHALVGADSLRVSPRRATLRFDLGGGWRFDVGYARHVRGTRPRGLQASLHDFSARSGHLPGRRSFGLSLVRRF